MKTAAKKAQVRKKQNLSAKNAVRQQTKKAISASQRKQKNNSRSEPVFADWNRHKITDSQATKTLKSKFDTDVPSNLKRPYVGLETVDGHVYQSGIIDANLIISNFSVKRIIGLDPENNVLQGLVLLPSQKIRAGKIRRKDEKKVGEIWNGQLKYCIKIEIEYKGPDGKKYKYCTELQFDAPDKTNQPTRHHQANILSMARE